MGIVSEDEGISFCEIQTLFLLKGKKIMWTGHADKNLPVKIWLAIFVYTLAFNLFLPKTFITYFHWQTNILMCKFFWDILTLED
jgi:hypothetical protein